jgi:AAA domain
MSADWTIHEEDVGAHPNGHDETGGALPFTTFAEINLSGFKRWIIKGVFARGEFSYWIAPPGKLKSALMAEVAIHAATGWDWRGHRNKGPCAVVYFALERGDLVEHRLAAYRARYGLGELPIAVVSRTINLMDPACVARIIATIRAVEARFGMPVGLIIFDTLAKGINAGGGDEDKAKDKGRACAHLRQVQDDVDTHVAAVGHTGKDEERGARGSNIDLADADIQIQIRGDVIKIADKVKMNDGATGILIRFRGLVHDFDPDEDGDPVTVNILDPEIIGAEDEPERKGTRKPKLPKASKIALKALRRALSETGKVPLA